MQNKSLLYQILIVFPVLCLLCCSGQINQYSEPVLTSSVPVYDDSTNTFSITVVADSIDGAILNFYLTEGGKIVQESQDGNFSGIDPFEDGYDVILKAQWKDTLLERIIHVVDFIVPDEPLDKMTADELEQLINNRDRDSRQTIYNHLTQGVKLIVKESNNQSPQILSDVFTLLVNDVWQAVEVVGVEYNNFNLISCITLKPVGETIDN